MARRHYKSRIHLLVAKNASTVVILQRKRVKLFHIVLVDADKRRVEEGSWFRGKLYALRCDVSFDSMHMVYLAMGRAAPPGTASVGCPGSRRRPRPRTWARGSAAATSRRRRCCAPTAGADLTSTQPLNVERKSHDNDWCGANRGGMAVG